MDMGRSGNGGGKMVTFDDAISGRRRNGSSSISSYLDMGRDADGGRATTPRPLPPAHAMASRRRTYADGELDVFSAERYFKGAMDGDGDRKEGFSVTTPVQVQPLVETAAAARPAAEAVVMAKPSSTRASTMSFTASSASSVNSQTALFRGEFRRQSSRDSRCCVQVGVFMRTCSGKRSVRVDGRVQAKEAPDAVEPAAATGIDWYRELRMHKDALGLSGDGNSHGLVTAAGLPPSLNLGTAKVAAVGREVTTGEEKEAAAELTFSSSMRRSNFTLVAPVRANNVPASGRVVGEPGGGAGKVGRGVGGGAQHLDDNDDDDDDGAGSESSSDLFEIKSLMIGDCPYEPSEASIQWSVVTADASERGDRVPARWVGGGGGGGGRGPPVAGRQLRGHRPGGILAGCTSHRAVDVSAATTKVVPNAAAAVVPMQQRRSEGLDKARSGA